MVWICTNSPIQVNYYVSYNTSIKKHSEMLKYTTANILKRKYIENAKLCRLSSVDENKQCILWPGNKQTSNFGKNQISKM